MTNNNNNDECWETDDDHIEFFLPNLCDIKINTRETKQTMQSPQPEAETLELDQAEAEYSAAPAPTTTTVGHVREAVQEVQQFYEQEEKIDNDMSDLPEEVKGLIKEMEVALAEADKFFTALKSAPYDEVTTKLSPEDRAKYDLTVMYCVNSLFWMLKRTYGEDPQAHPIKEEMDRIKERMMRLKEITDKAKMPKVDKGAAERIVRKELNIPQNKRKKIPQEENWENQRKEDTENPTKP